ncbi:MAG: aldo/keto reductase [Candidatus Humimicrobiaceae bacterium]
MYTSIKDRVKLNNNIEMPILGFGVLHITDNDEAANCVKTAIKHGYRNIDTAMIYGNEAGVGKGIKESGINREDLFITTKVWNSDHGYNETLKAFEGSMERLKLNYLDLYLIHWPVPKNDRYVQTWKALEKLYADGKVRAIGVSNFNISHLENIIAQCSIVPAVNQVEFHPWLLQAELFDYMKKIGIYPEAWSPLAQGALLDNETLIEIAKKYNKTVAQVIIRWDLQKDVITIPKSSKEDRIASNADVFDFLLSEQDIKTIDGLNKNFRTGPDPDKFDMGA